MFRSAVLAVLAVALSSNVAAAQTEQINYLAFSLSYDLPEPPQSAIADENYLTLALSYDLAEPAEAESLLTLALSYDLPEPQLLENYLAMALSYDLPEPPVENYLAFALSHDLAEPPQAGLLSNYLAFALSYELDEPEPQTPMAKPDFSITTVLARLDRQQRTMLSLYAAQGALQVLDVVTTKKALGAGHRELNPLFRSGSASKMVFAKAAVMGLNVYVVERLKKTHPKRAMWLLAGTNALMSFVVLNNAAVIMN